MTTTLRIALSTLALCAWGAAPAAAGPLPKLPGGLDVDVMPASCPDDASATSWLASWGDSSNYTAAPGGLFNGSLQWLATGTAALVEEANPYSTGDGDGTSALLRAGDTLTSPPVCVTRYHPFLRFAARALEGRSRLTLSIVTTDDRGRVQTDPLSDADGNRFKSWALSDRVLLTRYLPRDETVRTIQLRFSVRDGDGWLIDNVLVDPFKRG